MLFLSLAPGVPTVNFILLLIVISQEFTALIIFQIITFFTIKMALIILHHASVFWQPSMVKHSFKISSTSYDLKPTLSYKSQVISCWGSQGAVVGDLRAESWSSGQFHPRRQLLLFSLLFASKIENWFPVHNTRLTLRSFKYFHQQTTTLRSPCSQMSNVQQNSL